VVGSGADLGYTLGTWQMKDAAGTVVGTGNYVTIWRKTEGEGWRVAVDIGNED
jgi:hypothetical protein